LAKVDQLAQHIKLEVDRLPHHLGRPHLLPRPHVSLSEPRQIAKLCQ
jgi:hypothetical protein